MTRPPTVEPRRSDAWLTVAELARVLDMTDANARATLLPLVPQSARRTGRPLKVYARAVIEIWARKALLADAKPTAGEDPLLDGPSSPALERYRAARAELAEMEVEQRRGSLIPREEIHPTMARFASVMRGAVETLQREFGPSAAKVVNDAILEALGVVSVYNHEPDDAVGI